jgi:hypothetical protein
MLAEINKDMMVEKEIVINDFLSIKKLTNVIDYLLYCQLTLVKINYNKIFLRTKDP